LRQEEVREIDPDALYTYLKDRADDAGGKQSILSYFFQLIQVKINRMREVMGRNEADHLRANLSTIFLYEREYITYKVSTDEKNQVRGIDL